LSSELVANLFWNSLSSQSDINVVDQGCPILFLEIYVPQTQLNQLILQEYCDVNGVNGSWNLYLS